MSNRPFPASPGCFYVTEGSVINYTEGGVTMRYGMNLDAVSAITKNSPGFAHAVFSGLVLRHGFAKSRKNGAYILKPPFCEWVDYVVH